MIGLCLDPPPYGCLFYGFDMIPTVDQDLAIELHVWPNDVLKCYSTKLQDAGVSTRLCRLFRRQRLCEVQLRALPIPVP